MRTLVCLIVIVFNLLQLRETGRIFNLYSAFNGEREINSHLKGWFNFLARFKPNATLVGRKTKCRVTASFSQVNVIKVNNSKIQYASSVKCISIYYAE